MDGWLRAVLEDGTVLEIRASSLGYVKLEGCREQEQEGDVGNETYSCVAGQARQYASR